ncbi:hypothetical protein [Pyrococcus kukulkanii]|uniref:Uncharacterized protein n=1 Tax=Pyrococcus kukulkanii TaxID=1609559 RepID=A0ABV4T638_9EURY
MGVDAYGWIEVRDQVWVPAVKITHLADRNYELFSRVFGITENGIKDDAIIGLRGLPEDASPDVRDNYNEFKPEPYASWMTYDEFKELVYPEVKDCTTPDWELVFKLMKDLAEKYGDYNVRLVVWFDV